MAEARLQPPRLLSVNVGDREVDHAAARCGPRSGRSRSRAGSPLRGVNLVGDDQADRGSTAAPTRRSTPTPSRTAWWGPSSAATLGPGTFGENLTTEGLDVTSALRRRALARRHGVLEVAQPRLPASSSACAWATRGSSSASPRPRGPAPTCASSSRASSARATRSRSTSTRCRTTACHVPARSPTRSSVDPGLVPQALEAPELLPSLRELLSGRGAGAAG